MKAIKIDVENQTVRMVAIEPTLECYYKEIGCRLITTGLQIDGNNWLMVDDEGLLKPNKAFKITYQGRTNGYAYGGNGLIVGNTDDGEEADTTVELKDIQVEFLPEQEPIEPEWSFVSW